jgi:hypothetical protein
MGSTRIKGTKLTLTLGSPGEDYSADLTAYKLAAGDADKGGLVTFEDAAKGGSSAYKLSGTATQSTDSASFWRYVWDNVGETAAFTVAPHGNDEPTAAQPHFLGNVTIGKRPDLGGEAGADNEFSFDFEWDVDGEPVLDDGTEA